MTTITASMVKELRDKTGAGMMDCKVALTENSGDMESSVDWLRKKGLSKAAKKAGRIAAEGLIGITVEGSLGAAVEVNSETDFVARNEQFQEMVKAVAGLAPKADGDLAKLLAAKFPATSETVDEYLKELVSTIGENMSVRRTTTISVGEGVVADYMHNRVAPGLGKIGVLVALESKADAGKLTELGRQVAMHIAAANPLSVKVEDLDPTAVERERQIYVDQAKASGKSQEIAEKMVEGRLRKEFFQQVVLMQQTFLGSSGDGKQTVEQVFKEAEKALGGVIAIKGFVRYALGEGIEKKEEDFAAEVAKTMQESRKSS